MAKLLTPTEHETQAEFLARSLNTRRGPTEDQALSVFRREAKSVKLLDDAGKLGGWAIPFGGPVRDKTSAQGKDLDNEFFAADTNFCLDWFPDEGRPMLYDHGMDSTLKLDKIGQQVTKYVDPELGVWAETQLDMSHKYGELILDLAKKGVLGYSSGALGGYVRRGAQGKIEQWPWIELTATVRPANPYALIAPDAAKHFEGYDLSELAAKAINEEPPADDASKKLTIPDGMSMNDFREALEDAIEDVTGNDCVWVVDVRDGKVTASVGDDYDDYMQYDFKVGADGAIALDGNGVKVESQTLYVVTEGKLKELTDALAAEGWTKGTTKFSARHMGQLHESLKVMDDLHDGACDMGADCPLYVAPTKTQAPDPAEKLYPDLETEAQKEQRRELDALLATVKLEGR